MGTATPFHLGFIGAGQMAAALTKGWLAAGLLTSEHCRAADPSPESRAQYQSITGIPASIDNGKVIDASDILVLAVKPQALPALLEDIRSRLTERHLIISIAAGFSIERITHLLAASHRLVRVMPNTPCLVGCSASGYALSPAASAEDAAIVDRLFNAVGIAFRLPESLLDAVTGLSGSGPAYIYMLIEAMSDGGVRMGLPRSVATTLAAQTVLGSARMVLETHQHPAVLKDAVASPGGTTIAGIQALEQGAFRAAVINAIEAATRRSMELGKTSH